MGVAITRRGFLALGLAAPLVGAWGVMPGSALDHSRLRAQLGAGIDRDPSGAVVRVFDLDVGLARDVLLPATMSDALPAGYAPDDLVNAAAGGIPAAGVQLIRGVIVDDTRALLEAATSAGHNLYVASGFRSQAYQEAVFAAQVARRGSEEAANRYSARAGHSQHQLGTTIDFTDMFRTFRGSPQAAWLADNAHRFGFVLPYTLAATDRTGYVDEPWHARWVGSGLATQLRAANYQAWVDLAADDAVAWVRAQAGLDG